MKSSEFLFQAFHPIKIHPPRPIKITEAGQLASPRRCILNGDSHSSGIDTTAYEIAQLVTILVSRCTRLNDVHRKTGENRRKPIPGLSWPRRNVVARHTKKGPSLRTVTTNYSAMQTEKTNELSWRKERGQECRIMSREETVRWSEFVSFEFMSKGSRDYHSNR